MARLLHYSRIALYRTASCRIFVWSLSATRSWVWTVYPGYVIVPKTSCSGDGGQPAFFQMATASLLYTCTSRASISTAFNH